MNLSYAFKIIVNISPEALHQSYTLVSKFHTHLKNQLINHFNAVITYCLHQTAEILRTIKQAPISLETGSLRIDHCYIRIHGKLFHKSQVTPPLAL